MTVILPSKVDIRKFQFLASFLILSIFSSVFCLKACSSLEEKYTPRTRDFTEEFDHFNFLSGQKTFVAFLVLLIHNTSVLVLFIFSPDIILKRSRNML